MKAHFIAVNKPAKEYIRLSSIDAKGIDSSSWIFAYGAVYLFLHRHGSGNEKNVPDGPSIDVLGRQNELGEIDDDTYIPVDDGPSPLCFAGRWSRGSTFIIGNYDKDTIFYKVTNNYTDISVSFVEAWNFCFPQTPQLFFN